MRSELRVFLESLGAVSDLRIAILGIGNDLNGDDAAGVLAARGLRAAQDPTQEEMPDLFAAEDESAANDRSVRDARSSRNARSYWNAPLPGKDRLLLIDAGPSPESFTGPLRRFAPDVVLLIDAAQMGEEPGALRVFDWREAEGLSASTHTMPPSMLAEFLTRELGCQVALIGIQAKGLDFDSPVSDAVNAAVVGLYRVLREWLAGFEER